MKFSQDLQETIKYLNNELHTDQNFDVVYRVLTIGGRRACLYFIDGFTKDDSILKILQGLSSIKSDAMPEDAHSFSKQYLPYGEIGLIRDSEDMILQLLSGVSCCPTRRKTTSRPCSAGTGTARPVPAWAA